MELVEGTFVDYPKIIIGTNGVLKCPVCSKVWEKRGSGYGFVKRGVSNHVANCFEKFLTKNGFEMEQPYSMDRLGWKLVRVQDLTQDVLHITLKKVWFDMIQSGVKKEEYREIKPYWITRLCLKEFHTVSSSELIELYNNGHRIFKDTFSFVEAKNGYSQKSPVWKKELLKMSIGTGKLEWGGGADLVFVISLGKIIQ